MSDNVRSIRPDEAEARAERLANQPPPPQPPSMDEAWKASVESRLGELKGAIDGLRYGVTMLGGSVALVAVVMLGGFTLSRHPDGSDRRSDRSPRGKG